MAVNRLKYNSFAYALNLKKNLLIGQIDQTRKFNAAFLESDEKHTAGIKLYNYIFRFTRKMCTLKPIRYSENIKN